MADLDTITVEAPTLIEDPAVEQFAVSEDRARVVRMVRTRDCGSVTSKVETAELSHPTDGAAAIFDASWLRSRDKPGLEEVRESIRIVDLFSGCGGMTLGVAEACRALGFEARPVFAADVDPVALEVFSENFPDTVVCSDPLEEVIGLRPGDPLSRNQQRLIDELGRVDVLVGGPPCQGHSNLNNHSRRRDSKNELFAVMARAAEILRPTHVIIENVRDIVHDRNKVFSRVRNILESDLGYAVDTGVLRAEDLGVPQRRHRTFVVASRERHVRLKDVQSTYGVEPRSFEWACSDLSGETGGAGFDTAPVPRGRTKTRIDWLHDHEEYELPNDQRPQCHRDNHHSYLSVYGRLRSDEPVSTITTGFTCMGQGRFVHPSRRRTLTPHEAARLQFFPDFFRFGDLNREGFKRLIGNAVPAKFTYVIALELLR